MRGDGIAGFVRGLAGGAGLAGAADRDLLRAYLADGDEAAFALLVRRHDRLVRAAVGRVLADPADAADARQAAWLVLVRRAGAVRWRAGLGPWLYGVAHRVAVRLRAANRRRPGPLAADPPDPARPPDPSWREACDLLHAELNQLPDRDRLPLLLCYLEGHTRDEAAALLGVTAGVVKGRVRRGLAVLHRRLAARGVSPSAGLLAAVAGPAAGAAAGPVVVGGVVPPRVERLVKEVAVGAGIVRPLVGLMAGLAVAAGVTAGLVLGGGLTPADPPGPGPAAVAVAPAPRPAGVFLVEIDGAPVILNADGTERERLDPQLQHPTLSPDGRWLAGFVWRDGEKPWRLVVRPRDGRGEGHEVPLDWPDVPRGAVPRAAWSPDGKCVLVVCLRTNEGEPYRPGRVYDLAARKLSDLPQYLGTPVDWLGDGTTLLVHDLHGLKQGGWSSRLEWVPVAGRQHPVRLTPDDLHARGGRAAPAGRRLLYLAAPPAAEGDPAADRLYTARYETGWAAPLADVTAVDGPGVVSGACWSPDGKRVAYTLQAPVADPYRTAGREITLYTADPDGRNRVAVTTRTGTVPKRRDGTRPVAGVFFRVLDWR